MIKLSQRDSRWAGLKLGTSSVTIGGFGCTITSLSIQAGLTPDDVNERLKRVDGYANRNLVIWSKIKEAIPWLEFEWRGHQYDDRRVKKAISEYGSCLVEVDFDGTPNTRDRHWVLFIGGGRMIDPWTGRECSTSKYKILTGYSIIRVKSMINEGDVFKSKDRQDCFRLEGGKKCRYESEEAFLEDGRDWGELKMVQQSFVDGLGEGEPIYSRSQLVVKGLGEKLKLIFVQGDPISPKQLLLLTRGEVDELKYIRGQFKKLEISLKQIEQTRDESVVKVKELKARIGVLERDLKESRGTESEAVGKLSVTDKEMNTLVRDKELLEKNYKLLREEFQEKCGNLEEQMGVLLEENKKLVSNLDVMVGNEKDNFNLILDQKQEEILELRKGIIREMGVKELLQALLNALLPSSRKKEK